MGRGKGFFITLEGVEGSGKSSQARRLSAALRRKGLRVKTLRDPGSTRLGRSLRRVLLHAPGAISSWQEALLFIGGRVRLVEEGIAPALSRGEIVVCGTPEEIAAHEASHTGRALRERDRARRSKRGTKSKPRPIVTPPDQLRVIGARTHNLQNLTVSIPRDAMTVVLERL